MKNVFVDFRILKYFLVFCCEIVNFNLYYVTHLKSTHVLRALKIAGIANDVFLQEKYIKTYDRVKQKDVYKVY